MWPLTDRPVSRHLLEPGALLLPQSSFKAGKCFTPGDSLSSYAFCLQNNSSCFRCSSVSVRRRRTDISLLLLLSHTLLSHSAVTPETFKRFRVLSSGLPRGSLLFIVSSFLVEVSSSFPGLFFVPPLWFHSKLLSLFDPIRRKPIAGLFHLFLGSLLGSCQL